MRIPLGPVAHFSVTVRDLSASATWWTTSFDLEEYDRNARRAILGNDSVVIVLIEGTPNPGGIGHLAFRAPDIGALESARDVLRANRVDVEDPGDEIGPVAPGSPNIGLWFHDIDGYRWELYVQAPAS